MRFLTLIAMVLALSRSTLLAQPFTLEALIDESIRNNLSLKAERSNLTIAEARQITAALRPNPILSLGVQYLDILGTHFGPTNNAGPAEYDLRTDFILEGGKKRTRRIELAAEDRRLAELNFRESLRGLIVDVQSAFVDVLFRMDGLALAEENRKNFQSLVSINETRVKNGDLAQVELERSRIAALQFDNAILQAQSDLLQAKYKLQQLLGRQEASDHFEITGELRRDKLQATREEIYQRALLQRPDYLAMQQLLIRNQADLRLQVANGKIDYTVGAEARRQDGYAGRGNSMAVFLTMPLPVFNRNQGEIARASREGDQTKFRVDAMANRIQSEVRMAWQQYESATALLNRIEGDMLKRAEEVRKTTDYSYRRGEASLVELLDAQRAFNDTRQSYNEMRGAYARALYQLESIEAKNVAEGVKK
ncbi:TolC family protein [Bryobacter aggregatus]|uniref:TolC family protein n=1 Tax=Bryobacter aggregatus TaxID=360054 RepID=UPI0004E1D07C|nr:TolC family protein [Bryobacter aggregatus]